MSNVKSLLEFTTFCEARRKTTTNNTRIQQVHNYILLLTRTVMAVDATNKICNSRWKKNVLSYHISNYPWRKVNLSAWHSDIVWKQQKTTLCTIVVHLLPLAPVRCRDISPLSSSMSSCLSSAFEGRATMYCCPCFCIPNFTFKIVCFYFYILTYTRADDKYIYERFVIIFQYFY